MTLYAGRRYDVAEAALGRDDEGALVVEAVRPKSDVWRLELHGAVAGSPLALVARHHFDQGEGSDPAVLHVHHRHAERLVEVLAQDDHRGLVHLIANLIDTDK